MSIVTTPDIPAPRQAPAEEAIIDLDPFIQPGASEKVLRVAKNLAGLWREEIEFCEQTGAGRPGFKDRESDLTPLERRILAVNRGVRRSDLARGVKPTEMAQRLLNGSHNYQAEKVKAEFSIDPDFHINFRTYVFDRLAYLAAWHSLHPGSVE